MASAREDLIAFLAGSDEPVRIGRRHCSRCGDPCDLEGQWYCGDCRRLYQRERDKSRGSDLLFHGGEPDAVALLDFIRERASRRETR